jgi:serine/threonine-protein kinase
MLTASTRLGPYEIVAPLGAGGMGEVYRARDTRLGREVAVKVLPELFAQNLGRRARFEREARAVAALSHPNILAIHDYGTHGEITYAVMELLEGETLRSRLAQGPLPWREAIAVGAAIADGLAAAHAKGIVHRDLKPENLFLTADGRVKILDFGLARITPLPDPQGETGPYVPPETDAGTVMGTVGYMSPEQVRGQSVDARSDLFSFGCVLYEMVTGRRAFRRETAAETMTAILHDEPPDLTNLGQQIPAELGRVLRDCLTKSPNQRLQSARDLALALRATASDSVLHQSPVARRSTRLIVGIVAASLLIGVIGASVYFLTRGSNPSEAGKSVEEAKAIEALAVLPFENVGGDHETGHLSEGIPDSIIHSLAGLRLRDLKVRSLTSVARYKGRKPDLGEVRRELGVGVVVMGRLHQRGNRLAVSVALIDVRDGSELWGKQYDRRLDDILPLQDDIAKDIAANLRLHMTGEEERRLAKRDTENPEAYQLYLKGRYFWNKRTPEGLEKAIEYFRKATDTDPNYALAWAGLADVYAVFPIYTESRPSDSIPKAKAAARRALDIDNQLAEAYATLAFVAALYEWNWSEGERLFKRAIELNPMHATARHYYEGLLTTMGRFDEAAAQVVRAQELDPLSLIGNTLAGRRYYLARQYDAAIGQYRKALEMDPDFATARLFLGEAYAANGMYEEALAECLKLRRSRRLEVESLMGRAYALMRRPADAQKVIENLKVLSHERYIPPCLVALVYASLGEKDQALDWLEKAFEQGDWLLHRLKVDPAYDGLHSNPRFADLLRRMGLADKAAQRDQEVHSVAVLPFENVSGDPKTEFLSDGVADQIINSLSQLRRRDLKVRPFTSVSRYKGKKPDVPTFGRELNVQIIVAGKLHQQGDDLSISVALVDAREDNQLWGHAYQGKLGGILDLQDQIARDVAVNLRLRLTGEEEKRLTKRYTEDPEAYLLYREAIYHFNKFTEEGLTTAIEYCQRALKKDPRYAPAYATLGRCYHLLGFLHRGPQETYGEAKKYLDMALKFDETLPEAHSGLGVIYLYFYRNWPAAERELKRAFELDPSVPFGNLYGFYLGAMGRLPEALATLQRGQELDPLAALRTNEVAMCYNFMGQHDRAIAEAKKALELDPNFFLAYGELGLAYTQKGMYEEAIAALHEGLKRGRRHPRTQGLLGYAYAKAEQKGEAQKVLEDLRGLPKPQFGHAFASARIHAALGEKDQAFKWLQKACDEREGLVIWLKVDPTLDNLRSDPRFAQVVKDMGLPP